MKTVAFSSLNVYDAYFKIDNLDLIRDCLVHIIRFNLYTGQSLIAL